jgi:hypothetical protein
MTAISQIIPKISLLAREAADPTFLNSEPRIVRSYVDFVGQCGVHADRCENRTLPASLPRSRLCSVRGFVISRQWSEAVKQACTKAGEQVYSLYSRASSDPFL